MTEAPSANFDGNRNEAQFPPVACQPVPAPAMGLEGLVPVPFDYPPIRCLRISRDDPFGATAIVGGTNVRLCVSTAGETEPLVYSVKWQDLHAELNETLQRAGISFEDAKSEVFTALAKKFVDEVAKIFPEDGKPPPFDKMCAFNFSVAGPVTGEGFGATVSTSNTGVSLKNEAIALTLMGAINTELQHRRWPTVPLSSTVVMNDATAGLLGELYGGGLRGCQHGLYVIIGTGVGSMGLVNGHPDPTYSELGHSALITYDTSGKRFVVRNGRDTVSSLGDNGCFKDLPFGQHYLENDLAGPWLAVRFVQKLSKDYTFLPVLVALAERIAPFMPGDYKGDLIRDLVDLGDLPSARRQQWAINSPSGLVKAVNRFLLSPNAEELLEAVPCDWNIAGVCERDPKEGLVLLGIEHWKSYLKDVGHALGEVCRKMSSNGTPPEKIVIGGGIGEVCAAYPPFLKNLALKIIHRHGKLPADTVVFSSMSPEARESAVTSRAVDEAMLMRLAASPSLS